MEDRADETHTSATAAVDDSASRSSEPKQGLSTILDEFTSGLAALRVFLNQVGTYAADHDGRVIDEFLTGLRSLLGLSEVSESGPSPEGASDSATDQRVDRELIADFLSIPGNLRKLSKLNQRLREAAPQQTSIHSRSVIVLLAISLETLISNLAHAFYQFFPAALPDEGRQLTLKELRGFESLREAEAFLIAQEVDSLLRAGLLVQIEYFSKRPKVDTKPLVAYLPRLNEISQRRNLIVHNRSVVNRTYLKLVADELVQEFAAVEGEPLPVSREYLSNAIDTVGVVGTILAQQCWRKWDKGSLEAANGFLVSACYEALVAKRNEVVESLAEYAASIDLRSDSAARTMCVNRAIVLRDTGYANEAARLLDTQDWSSCAARYLVAYYAVRGEEDALYRELGRAVSAEEIGAVDVAEWPLFHPYRQSARFRAEMESLFDPEEAAAILSLTTQDEVSEQEASSPQEIGTNLPN